MTEKPEAPKKPEIVYFSWSELDRYGGDPCGSCPSHDDDYISRWAKKIREFDPDGRKARELAEKYRKPASK